MTQKRIFTNKFYFVLSVLVLATVVFAVASFDSYAASAPNATGKVNSKDGAYIRKSSSVNSNKIVLLKDNTTVIIMREVFKSKTSTSDKKRWYYVSAGTKKGYIRADLVDSINYKFAPAKAKKATNYRKGAGTKMKKKGRFKKNNKMYV